MSESYVHREPVPGPDLQQLADPFGPRPFGNHVVRGELIKADQDWPPHVAGK